MVEDLVAKRDQIEVLCRKYNVVRLDVFGSAARGNFDPERSDFDFLVDFGEIERKGFDDVYFKLLIDLEELLGRQVHLVEEHCQDDDFMKYASRSRQPLYAA
jgi:uncharacterized protein